MGEHTGRAQPRLQTPEEMGEEWGGTDTFKALYELGGPGAIVANVVNARDERIGAWAMSRELREAPFMYPAPTPAERQALILAGVEGDGVKTGYVEGWNAALRAVRAAMVGRAVPQPAAPPSLDDLRKEAVAALKACGLEGLAELVVDAANGELEILKNAVRNNGRDRHTPEEHRAATGDALRALGLLWAVLP